MINKIVDLEGGGPRLFVLKNGIIEHEPRDQDCIPQGNVIDARAYQERC